MSSLDYLDLCRLCLVKDGVSVPIFEGETFLKISACLPVKVTREDKLPKKICHDCVCKVELFYDFCNTTANSEKQLLQLLGDVHMEDDKQNYIETVLSPNRMKSDEGGKNNRLEDTVMQQVSEHQNSMNIMDNIMDMPMMISGTTQQQITSVPMDTTGESVQNVPVAGPSTQMTHEQVHINQNQSDTPMQQEEEEESSEEEENFEEECDADEGLPVKEESEEDPNNRRTVEPTTFVNVSLTCEEAGPSGLQQQKIPDIPDTMVLPQTEDVDPKTGLANGRFLFGKESIQMQPWQVVDLEGCLYYAFLPVNQTPKMLEASQRDQKQNMSAWSTDDNKDTPLFARLEDAKTEEDEIDEFCPIKVENEMAMDTDDVLKDEESYAEDEEGSTLFICKKCNICFPLMRMLQKHQNTVHKDDTPDEKDVQITYRCDFCSFESTNKSTFASHVNRKHTPHHVLIHRSQPRSKQSSKPEECLCDVCDFKCQSRRRLQEHIDRKHGSEYKYSCEYCGKRFKVKGDMRLHVRFKHKEGPIICDVCGKTCSNSNSLYVHQKWAHFKPKFECHVCKRRMVSQENLDQHILLQHERRECFVCEECGKSFTENHRLKQHMMIHTGDRPHICHICGKAFTRRTAYRQHLLLHTGARPYICDICGKAFTQKPGLICHRKSHPGEHPPLPVVYIDHIINDFMKKQNAKR